MVTVTHAHNTRKRMRKVRPVVNYQAPAPVLSMVRTENRTWEPEEDEGLLAAVKEWGSKWKLIAATLPGRSEAMCRNRYQRINAPLNGAPSRNKCTYCGQLKRGHTCYRKRELVVDSTGALPMAASSPLTVDSSGARAAALAPRPRRPSLPPNPLLPSVTDGGFEIDPEVAAAMCMEGGAAHAPEPSPAGALGASALVHLGLPGPDAETNGTDADMPMRNNCDDDDDNNDAGVALPAVDGIAGEVTWPLSVRFPACEEDEADDPESDADYRGPTPTPREIPSPAATPCDEPRIIALAPPKPARLAHSFDLGSLLAQRSADDLMVVPLDAVTEALLAGDNADAVSSQESVGESICTLPPMLPPTRAFEEGACSYKLSEKGAMLCDREAMGPPLCKFPSWSRPPSFSCFAP